MLITMLKSKIHRAVVTDADLHYEGSITICRELAELADMREFEKVLVANVDNGQRFETYVILGGKGEICLNGATAHLGKRGDKVIIMAWTTMAEAEAEAFAPRIVLVGDDNRPKH